MDFAALTDPAFGLILGLSLAATCGLRAFLPLLCIGAAGAMGKVELADAFQWMASPAALACFGSAVVLEVSGDKIPAVDHVLDSLGVVVKPLAAAVAAASMIQEFDPLLALTLGLIGGGAVAEVVHLAKAKTRLLSTAFTGTLANPFLSVGEDLAALAAVVLAFLVPGLVLLAIVAVAVWTIRRWRRTDLKASGAA
jgi:hypothetical protein